MNPVNLLHISADGNVTVHINAPESAASQPWWHRTAVIWTAIGAVATVATAVIAWLALH
ncbi:hypothetical protein OG361_06955 [Streptomyces sp. NBC_00090]|uniref:hypothetical protein n=1 Tax=Streptomyces sp. NBC_00090 TaxID=2903619 RepID=UPI00324AD390